MIRHRVAASARVSAPAFLVYGILADYREGHPRILPPEYFTGLNVEQGGVGAGTVITFGMRVLGRTRYARAVVTEPEPGRVLMETIPDSNLVTTFTVVPLAPAAGAEGGSEVTIATELNTRGGVLGAVERRLTTALLQRVYVRELEILTAYAAERAKGEPARAAGEGGQPAR